MITNLNKEEFSEHIESLKTEITEEPTCLGDEFEDHWYEITTRQYDFDKCELFFISLLQSCHAFITLNTCSKIILEYVFFHL